MDRVPGLFREGEAALCRTDDRSQIVLVRLVSRIRRIAEAFGGEGVDDATRKTRVRERMLDGQVVFSGAFNGDDDVLDRVLRDRLAQSQDGHVEAQLGVVDLDGRNENVPVEV